MSFPGPVGGAANLACDTGLQRATDQFNFQLNTGAAGETSSLQSPASITPDTVGNATLTVNPNGNNRGTINVGNSDNGAGQANVSAVVSLANGSTGFSEVDIGGVALGSYGNFSTLTISQTGVPANQVASFNASGNTVILGNAATAGTITMNGSATVSNGLAISDASGGTNQLILSPLSATTSLIVQDPVGGTGTISIGPSGTQPGTLQVSNVPRTGIANYVSIGSNGGTAANLVFTGAQGSSPFTGIFTDTAEGTGGQLNLSSNNAAGQIVSIRDNGMHLNLPIDPDFQSNSTTVPGLITGTINNGTALVTGNYYPLPNNPPSLASCTGLYCIMLVQTTTATAVINNAQVSTMAYWNGSSGTWTFGGSNLGSPLTGGNVHIGFGPTATTKATLYVGYGAIDNGCILNYVMVPIYQSLGI